MYWIYNLVHLLRYIVKYAYKSMLNKRWITLSVICCRPFTSKAVFLGDLEGVWVRLLLFLITERQGRNTCFERALSQERCSPRKSHRTAFKLCSKKRSLSYNGSVLWNSLSLKMRQLTSLNVFKGKLKNFNLDICNLCTRPSCKAGFLLLYLCYFSFFLRFWLV